MTDNSISRSNGHQAWDRQPGETTLSYSYFTVYRDLGPVERSDTAVAKIISRAPSVVNAHMQRHSWKARAIAYDTWFELQLREAQEGERIKMARRQAQIGMTMQERATEGLDMLDMTESNANEIARLASEGTKIERLARGESTENIAGKGVILHWEGSKPPWAQPQSPSPTPEPAKP
ncbi:MAG: hypothetical protein V3S55_13945 [Nitrospiraceae bacterium]